MQRELHFGEALFVSKLQQDKTRLILAYIRVLTRQACYDMARRVKMAYNENSAASHN